MTLSNYSDRSENCVVQDANVFILVRLGLMSPNRPALVSVVGIPALRALIIHKLQIFISIVIDLL